MCSNYDKKSCLSTASFPTAVSESKKTRVADVSDITSLTKETEAIMRTVHRIWM